MRAATIAVVVALVLAACAPNQGQPTVYEYKLVVADMSMVANVTVDEGNAGWEYVLQAPNAHLRTTCVNFLSKVTTGGCLNLVFRRPKQ